jgi:hypothetical protein
MSVYLLGSREVRIIDVLHASYGSSAQKFPVQTHFPNWCARMHGQSAGKRRVRAIAVAGNAIARACEVLAALDIALRRPRDGAEHEQQQSTSD